MAYTMTHILIAEKVQSKLNRMNDYSTYILGTIAPDAVHACSNFTVEMKECSHLFTEGLRWGKITEEREVIPWLENIKKFYINSKHKYNSDFLLGYVVHLLADVYCSIHFFAPFLHSIDGDYAEKMEQFKRESYIVNYYLFLLFSKEKNLCDILRTGEAITIERILAKEVIKERIEQLNEFEFRPWDISHIREHQICRIEDMQRMIEDATVFIVRVLREDYCLPEE